jgi:chemotaxis protein MotB
MLFSMSTLDAEKFQQAAASFSSRESLFDFASGIDDFIGSGIMDLPSISNGLFQSQPSRVEVEQMITEMQSMASDFKTYFAEYENLADQIIVEHNEASVTLIFDGGMLFDPGRADLKDEAIAVLNIVANEAFRYPDNLIEIEGHTDNVPMRSPQFASNWHLSFGRAVSVLQYFVDDMGIDPVRISARGFSEYRPIADNDTPEGRARNRRVEIRFLSSYLTRELDVSDATD